MFRGAGAVVKREKSDKEEYNETVTTRIQAVSPRRTSNGRRGSERGIKKALLLGSSAQWVFKNPFLTPLPLATLQW